MSSSTVIVPTQTEIDAAIDVLLRSRGTKLPSNLVMKILSSSLPRSQLYSAFPIKDEMSWEFYTRQEAQDWSAKEIEWDRDRKDFAALPPRHQQLFLELFGVFLPLDGAVSVQLQRMLCEAPTYEAMMFFTMQMKIELTHSEAYGMAAQSVPLNDESKVAIFEMVDKQECVAAKAEYIEKYIDSDKSWALRAVAAACSEGIFFVSLFSLVFYFRSKNVLPAFIHANSQIMLDETLHRDFFCAHAARELKMEEHEEAKKIIEEAVTVEFAMLDFLLRTPIDSIEADEASGLTVENMRKYIQGLGDQIAELVGIPPIYNISWSPPWCGDMGLSQRNNFYEARGATYKRFDPVKAMDWKARTGLTQKVEVNPIDNPSDIDF
jgi:ribonucleotide reductase beta subunit family protein with ferritin-like domain